MLRSFRSPSHSLIYIYIYIYIFSVFHNKDTGFFPCRMCSLSCNFRMCALHITSRSLTACSSLVSQCLILTQILQSQSSYIYTIYGHVYVTYLGMYMSQCLILTKSLQSRSYIHIHPHIYIYIYTQWPKYAPPYGMYIHICTCSQDVPTISVTVDCTFENACLVQEQDIVLCTKQVPCKSSMSLV